MKPYPTIYKAETKQKEVLKPCVWIAVVLTLFYLAYGILTHLLGVGEWNF
jgi:hypothetical protein